MKKLSKLSTFAIGLELDKTWQQVRVETKQRSQG